MSSELLIAVLAWFVYIAVGAVTRQEVKSIFMTKLIPAFQGHTRKHVLFSFGFHEAKKKIHKPLGLVFRNCSIS